MDRQGAGSRGHRPVLIVDDDADHRRAVRGLLEDEGYAVVEAANGRAALDYLMGQGNALPSVIFLDLHMPVMTGWELLAIIKSYLRLARVPVVLVSGEQMELDLVKHGTIAAFLRKPYDSKELIALAAKYGAGS